MRESQRNYHFFNNKSLTVLVFLFCNKNKRVFPSVFFRIFFWKKQSCFRDLFTFCDIFSLLPNYLTFPRCYVDRVYVEITAFAFFTLSLAPSLFFALCHPSLCRLDKSTCGASFMCVYIYTLEGIYTEICRYIFAGT